MKSEIVSKPFYSNCFLQAITHKITHPLTVKITVVPKSEAGCLHCLWSDGIADYDFGVERKLIGLHKIWFKGYIRKRNHGFNEKYKTVMKKKWARKDGAE